MKTIELKVKQSIFDNGTLYSISYLNDKNQFHNEYGPAILHYHNNGNVCSEQYCINNRCHNENGPAVIEYTESGKIALEKYVINEKLHNKNGPAIIYYHNILINKSISEYFYINGKELTKENFIKKFKNKIKNGFDGKIVEIDGKKYSLTEVK